MSTQKSGRIHLHNISLPAYIGVPAAERAELQVLHAHVTLWPTCSFAQMQDGIQHTIDYAAVVSSLRQLTLSRPRALLETLADELAEHLLQHYNPSQVRITLLKHILPGVDHVSVEIEKTLN